MSLIIAIMVIVFSAVGVTFEPANALPTVTGRVVARDGAYAFVALDGDCNPRETANCARYAAVALQDAMPGLTWAQMAAIITQTEFASVWDDSTRDVIAELVWRRLLDRQSGALRYDGLYHPTADNLVAALATFQGIIDSVTITEGFAVVNVSRLLGVRDCAAAFCRGYTRFVEYLTVYYADHAETLRSGLGYAVPSVSGLVCIPAGMSITSATYIRREVGRCRDGAAWFVVTDLAHRWPRWA